MLGRRGRVAVIGALLRGGQTAWSQRGLASEAGVPHAVAARAVAELETLGAVSVARPGRAAQVRWSGTSPLARWLATLEVPDPRRMGAEAFAAGFAAGHRDRRAGDGLLLWRRPEDDPRDPRTPARVAVVARDPDAAVDAVDPGLDAVAARGLPAPEVSIVTPGALREEDPVAAAMRRGNDLRARPARAGGETRS